MRRLGPCSQAHHVVHGTRIANNKNVRLGRHLAQARGNEEPGCAMSDRSISEKVIRTKAQDAPGKHLIFALDDLGIVVGVGRHDAAARGSHSHELAQGGFDIVQMLEDAIDRACVNTSIPERKHRGIRSHHGADSPSPPLSAHVVRPIEEYRTRAAPAGVREDVGTSSPADVEARLAAREIEQLTYSVLVLGIEGLTSKIVEAANPFGGVRLTIDVVVPVWTEAHWRHKKVPNVGAVQR